MLRIVHDNSVLCCCPGMRFTRQARPRGVTARWTVGTRLVCSLGGLQQQQQVRKLEDAERHLRRLRPRPCAEPAPAARPQTAEEQQGKAEPCPAARPRRASCTLRGLKPCAARPPGCCWVHDAVAFGPTTQWQWIQNQTSLCVCSVLCCCEHMCDAHADDLRNHDGPEETQLLGTHAHLGTCAPRCGRRAGISRETPRDTSVGRAVSPWRDVL